VKAFNVEVTALCDYFVHAFSLQMILKTERDSFCTFIKQNKSILILLGTGFLARVIYTICFSKFVAQNYFGQDSLFTNSGDFSAWVDAIKNLVRTGDYTVNADNSYGYFGRMPGYAIFIAPFYFIFGESYFTYTVSFAQVLLDTSNIYLIYRIYKNIFPYSTGYSPYIAPLIYAIHPINILWSSALFSEALSVFLLLLSLCIYTSSRFPYKYFTFGFISGFNILVRPQVVLFALLFVVLQVLLTHPLKSKKQFTGLCLFIFGLLIAYTPWPARNYLLHDKIVLTQDISGFANWGIDVHSYMHYIVSIQNNWEPQFGQIIHRQPFEIDTKNAYVTPTDSADLAKAVFLAQYHGSGFSNWAGYWQEKIDRNKNDTTIAELFTKLQRHQMKYNAFHYWLTLPLSNLKKCFFKLEFTHHNPSVLFKLATLMFVFRTLVILLGLVGSVLLFKNQEPIFKLILLFFVSWYLLICWGPSAQMRNIEMRYLLQVDTLMIIPASYYIGFLLKSKLASIISKIR
jgi:hypothetical protein